jgi:putative transposase
VILTFKIKHDKDFTVQLKQAKQIAEFAVANRDKLSSKNVSHIGLKSVISNQILRKYGGNKKCKNVRRVNLIVPSQGIKLDVVNKTIRIPSLDFEFTYQFGKEFSKVNQIEINREYIFVSVTVPEEKEYESNHWLGVDRNTTGHCCVAASSDGEVVLKLGRKAQHTHKKYSKHRKYLQRQKRRRALSRLKKRESRIVRDLNHKISKKLVQTAKEHHYGIKLEDLSGIRKSKNHAQSFQYFLHSWSFYQLQQMIEYKAKLLGVPVGYVEPQYTSQTCSRCGLIGNRKGKLFTCSCGHRNDADVNAGFNISRRELKEVVDSRAESSRPSNSELPEKETQVYSYQLHSEEDECKGSTDTPGAATVLKATDHRTPVALA